jgi:AcrR family transcriptional regulator
MFAARGFDSVSTAEIAAATGVSQSVVLYHFTTKENLWREAMRHLFQQVDVRALLDKDVYKDLDVVSRLKIALRRFVQTSARFPQIGGVLLREGVSGGERLDWLISEFLNTTYGAFFRLFEEGAAAGKLKRFDPPLLTIMVHSSAAMVFNLSPLTTTLLGKSPFDDDVVERQADMIVEVLLNGLLGDAGETPLTS